MPFMLPSISRSTTTWYDMLYDGLSERVSIQSLVSEEGLDLTPALTMPNIPQEGST